MENYDDDFSEEMEIEAMEQADSIPQDKKTIFTITIDADEYISGSIKDKIIERISLKIAQDAHKEISQAVKEKVNEIVDAKYAEVAEKYVQEFFSKQHKKTNTWGEQTGQEYSVRELLTDRMEKYLAQNVNTSGNADNYSKTTRMQWIINEYANKPLATAIQEEVKKVSDEAKKQLQALIGRYIAEQLTPVINVPQLPK